MNRLLKILKSKIFQICATVILLYLIIWKFDIELKNIFTGINDISYLVLALFLVLILRTYISALRWKIFLHYSGINESAFSLIKITLTSSFFSLLLPFTNAHDAFRIIQIEKKYPEKRGYSGGTVLADRMIGLVLFCFIASFGAFFLPSSAEMDTIKIILFVALFSTIVLTLIVINQKVYEIFAKILNKIPVFKILFNYISKLHKSLTLLPYREIIPRVVPLTLLFQLINVFLAFLVFRSLDIQIAFYYHLVFIPIIQIITLLPVSAAGLGFREGVFIYFYNYLNISAEISFTASIIYFIINAVIPSLIGGLIIIFEKLKIKELLLVRNKRTVL